MCKRVGTFITKYLGDFKAMCQTRLIVCILINIIILENLLGPQIIQLF